MKLSTVTLIVENRSQSASKINDILHQHGEKVIGRLGIPKDGKWVITTMFDGARNDLKNMLKSFEALNGVKVIHCSTE